MIKIDKPEMKLIQVIPTSLTYTRNGMSVVFTDFADSVKLNLGDKGLSAVLNKFTFKQVEFLFDGDDAGSVEFVAYETTAREKVTITLDNVTPTILSSVDFGKDMESRLAVLFK